MHDRLMRCGCFELHYPDITVAASSQIISDALHAMHDDATKTKLLMLLDNYAILRMNHNACHRSQNACCR